MSKGRVVYIDIESLLDLRQGYLLSLPDRDVEETYQYLSSDEYLERKSDEFRIGSLTGYQDAIQRGIKSVIINSTVTYLCVNIVSAVNNIINRNAVEVTQNHPVVWVNVYPFVLNDDEIDVLKNALFSRLGVEAFIEIVTIAPEELSPSWLSGSEITTVIMYDFHKWLGTHAAAIPNVRLENIQFYFPKIYAKAPSTEQEIASINEIEQLGTLFELHRVLIEQFLKITFIPIVLYCNTITFLEKKKEYDAALEEMVEEERLKVEKQFEESGLSEQLNGEQL